MFVVASLVLISLSLAFASSDLGAVLCFGIALFSALALFAVGVLKKGRQRLAALFIVRLRHSHPSEQGACRVKSSEFVA